MAPVTIYDANDDASLILARDAAEAALNAYASAASPVQAFSGTIEHSPDLIGIDPGVYRQIQGAINSNKRHIMFYGPPGTGKTELARYVAELTSPTGYTIVTGSADWTSQDLIGGYQPMGGGSISFIAGILLKNFARPFIIDELNRCDIDKVLGPLFTVLSKSSTTLPYRVDVSKADSEQFQILGDYDPLAVPPIYSPHPNWRLIATINTIDKASLYQISYALSRRFAWVFVDVPTDITGFIVEFLKRRNTFVVPPANGLVLANIWQAVNMRRPMGAAPFIDVIKHCLAMTPSFDFGYDAPATDAVDIYLDAFKVHVMPMLDGELKDDLRTLAHAVSAALGMSDGDTRTGTLVQQLASIGL